MKLAKAVTRSREYWFENVILSYLPDRHVSLLARRDARTMQRTVFSEAERRKKTVTTTMMVEYCKLRLFVLFEVDERVEVMFYHS